MQALSSAAEPAAARQPRFAGRRLLVTGAANGIGRETARRFVREGAAVALLDRDAAPLAAAAGECGMPHFTADVADAAQVTQAVTRAADALGGLDGVVNAAGLWIAKSLEELTPEDWQLTMQINLIGPFLVVKAALPALRRAGGATVVNIASVGALRPARNVAAYCASKAGLLMAGKCMAFELAPDVRVNTVCPGTVETAMTERLLTDEATRARLTANATGRLGQPGDIADAILYLTSGDSAFVNGATLVVDGGAAWF